MATERSSRGRHRGRGLDDGHRRGRPHRRRPHRPRHHRPDRSRPSTCSWGMATGPSRRRRSRRDRPSSPNVVAADLTGNGIEDLIVPDDEHRRLVDLAGPGRRQFPPPILSRSASAPGAWRSATSPATASSTWPSPTASKTPSRSCWATATARSARGNDPDGGSSRRISPRPTSLATAILDLVVSNFYLRHDLDLLWQRRRHVPEPGHRSRSAASPGNPVVADFNGDGLPDIAVPDDQSQRDGLHGDRTDSPTPRPTISRRARGRTCWRSATSPATASPTWSSADTGSSGLSYVTVLMGNGDGTFRTGQTIPVGVLPVRRHSGRSHRRRQARHRRDQPRGQQRHAAHGHGDGTFLPPIEVPAGAEPYALAVADFNGDGRLDIAVANYEPGDVTVMMNQGGGVFAPAGSISSGVRRSRWSPPTSTTTAGSTSPSPTRFKTR